MTRHWSCLLTLMLAASAPAQEALLPPRTVAQGKLIQEVWQSATIDGVRSGYVLFTVTEMEANGQKFHRATRQLSLTLLRFGQRARVEAVTGTDESLDGRVIGTFMRQGLGKEVELNVSGAVEGDKLHVTAQGKMQFDKRIPWDQSVVGVLGEVQMIARRKPQAGDKFDYLIYEPIINSLIKVHAQALAIEQVNVAGQTPYLLKMQADPEEIQGIQLPGSIFWYDAKYDLVKSESLMPGLGKLVVERTTREDALKPCLGPDLGWKQSIQLKQPLAHGQDTALAIYRIRLKDKKLDTVFALDERQSIKSSGPDYIELQVSAVRQPPEVASAAAVQPGAEFLESNNFITSADPKVRELATRAIGAETDPWKKAKSVERWVNENMKSMNFSEAMAPASTVAATLQGDCTEYSMLAAAMCRAVGVPSKTALGLVYVPATDVRPPMFAMHMWTEVWVRGDWVSLDATLGRGGIGAAHIKVTDHSWHKVATMTPLMPLMRLMVAEPTVEILQGQLTQSGKP